MYHLEPLINSWSMSIHRQSCTSTGNERDANVHDNATGRRVAAAWWWWRLLLAIIEQWAPSVMMIIASAGAVLCMCSERIWMNAADVILSAPLLFSEKWWSPPNSWPSLTKKDFWRALTFAHYLQRHYRRYWTMGVTKVRRRSRWICWR